jgi:hypothetical protein
MERKGLEPSNMTIHFDERVSALGESVSVPRLNSPFLIPNDPTLSPYPSSILVKTNAQERIRYLSSPLG